MILKNGEERWKSAAFRNWPQEECARSRDLSAKLEEEWARASGLLAEVEELDRQLDARAREGRMERARLEQDMAERDGEAKACQREVEALLASKQLAGYCALAGLSLSAQWLLRAAKGGAQHQLERIAHGRSEIARAFETTASRRAISRR